LRINGKDTLKDENCLKFSFNSISIIFCLGGIVIVSLIFLYQFIVIYSISDSKQITMSENQIFNLNNLALPIFTLFLLGLFLFLTGIINLFKRWTLSEYIYYNKNILVRQYYNFRNISSFALKGSGKKIFSISIILYLILALFFNNTIVYNHNISFSSSYGVHIPSIVIIGCCGHPGEFPIISFYITDHFGLMLIPINLLTAIVISILAALNISLLYTIYKTNKNLKTCKNSDGVKEKLNLFSLFGLVSGLFVICPTCVGNLMLFSILGSSLVSFGITISFTFYHSIFLSSFVLLLVFPILVGRNNSLFVKPQSF